jgi:uncharacterized protein
MILDTYFDSIAQPVLQDEQYQSLKKYIAHSDFTVYDHSLMVAERAYIYAKNKHLQLDYASLIRGALLHDFYLYDWHKSHKGHRLHGFRHPAWALHNANLRFELNDKEKNIIFSHMWPLTLFQIPHSKEAWLVCHFDTKQANIETFSCKKDVKLPVLLYPEKVGS